MGVHDGHREREKERFARHGLDSFSDVNVLELLLFFSVPRRDTNEAAHALLDRFDSLAGVFDADIQSLVEVPGVGYNSALLIKLVPQIMRRYEQCKGRAAVILDSVSKSGTYFCAKFRYQTEESVLLASLDAKRRVISCDEIGRGTVCSVNVDVRKIVETALRNKAVSVILAHNHPDGVAEPSNADILYTRKVKEALDTINLELADHIITSDDKYFSFRERSFFSRYRI